MQVSVIIPTYKPKEYLWAAIDSLVKQTLDPSQYEVIIVLNGPQDNYLADIAEHLTIVESETMLIPAFRILYTEKPGVSNARNKGLEAATGTYIAFIDDDDWVSPTYLSDLLAAADVTKLPYELTGKKAGPVIASYVLNSVGDRYVDDYITRAYNRCSKYKQITLMNGRSLLSSSCCKLIARTVIGDTRFDTNITHGEDALFMATISHRINSIRLANPDAIYYRRVRSDSARFRKRPFYKRVINTTLLCSRYTWLLLQAWKYEPKFILTRIAATLRNFA